VLEGARERFARRAAAAGRTLSVDCDDGLRASLDPLRIEQALGNLVDNALRHGAGAIVLAARGDDGSVELSVADDGAMDDGLAARAFERFTRGDQARARGGTGLGLAIVAAIAAAHGGEAVIAEHRSRTVVALRLPSS
jgi:signal transduction histidine kinase